MANVGQPTGNLDGLLHVTGKTVFTDDIPCPDGTLHIALGTSAHAHAQLVALDLAAVRGAHGVVAVLTADDVIGRNGWSALGDDEPIFAEKIVEYVGQSLFAVVATTPEHARHAARLATPEYRSLDPIVDLDSAIAAESFLEASVVLERGEAERAIDHARHRLVGQVRTGSQEHFYLEGQVALAIPVERRGAHVISSTQNPSDVQRLVARALAVSDAEVVVESRRLGGGFGGKETQAALFACIAALAADATRRPVKLRMRRDEDMIVTGKRHDFLVDYSVGFDDRGTLDGLMVTLSSRCGHSMDLSSAVNGRALLHCDNCYFLENVKLVSHRYKTHTASNTAFRGFGAPQATLAIECVMEEIARYLELDPTAVRRQNFYGASRGRTTPYGMEVEDDVIEQLVDELKASCEYDQRRERIDAFNARSAVLKRGLALTPAKYGISFVQTHLNQAGALIHVYTDGSVFLNHGGVEMGQGLHTKIAQIVADELGIALDQVRSAGADTSRVPNTSPTAASTGTDLNGKAAQIAARRIKRRLMRYAAATYRIAEESIEFGNGFVACGTHRLRFAQLVREAHLARISLSATGHYKTPKIHFDETTFTGRPFYYFVYGAAASEVLVDTLTGEYRTERVDILQDVGRSLNPVVDRGQIEGAFVQGLGWLTSEELIWSSAGVLETVGPSTYKIPTSYDRPTTFNIDLAKWGRNRENAIYRSKGVGEPPLLLAASVFLAIKAAMSAAAPAERSIALDAPATPERVLLAIERAKRAKARSSIR